VLLYLRTVAREWLLPDRKEVLALLDGYIVSFTRFHECGFAMPPYPFFWGLLHHY
jgi:hypothetical protein